MLHSFSVARQSNRTRAAWYVSQDSGGHLVMKQGVYKRGGCNPAMTTEQSYILVTNHGDKMQ
jgi:hypothetical protein